MSSPTRSPLTDHNPASSPVLVEALIREGGQWCLDEVTELGAISGGARAALGRTGRPQRPDPAHPRPVWAPVDEVEYDPAYHELMRTAIGTGCTPPPWADDRPGAHVVRAAKMSVWTPNRARLPDLDDLRRRPALRHNPELSAIYEPLTDQPRVRPELGCPPPRSASPRACR